MCHLTYLVIAQPTDFESVAELCSSQNFNTVLSSVAEFSEGLEKSCHSTCFTKERAIIIMELLVSMSNQGILPSAFSPASIESLVTSSATSLSEADFPGSQGLFGSPGRLRIYC